MYIIEDGRIDEDKEYRYFKCTKCGCEFIADNTEWQWQYGPTSFTYIPETIAAEKIRQIYCDCPTKGCETIIYRDFRFNPKIDYNPAEDYI